MNFFLFPLVYPSHFQAPVWAADNNGAAMLSASIVAMPLRCRPRSGAALCRVTKVALDGALNCIKMRNAHTRSTPTPHPASRPHARLRVLPGGCWALTALTLPKRRHLFVVAPRGAYMVATGVLLRLWQRRGGGKRDENEDSGRQFLRRWLQPKWHFIYFYWQMSTRRFFLCSTASKAQKDICEIEFVLGIVLVGRMEIQSRSFRFVSFSNGF